MPVSSVLVSRLKTVRWVVEPEVTEYTQLTLPPAKNRKTRQCYGMVQIEKDMKHLETTTLIWTT